ncbi:TRAP transporter large permease [Pseudohoeflea coraliihabitans]|uniref:TRAP transporter large permease protein n=1 Tax=Pseudohoeflea coraliihabitans TaxID=2860393 RepID=A0ABS6WQ77_9HYPH|nr:TRAP transporter large permease [Pseudohoeflea sp. DP4N28-3]MBW3097214.1 TRAP transporter large permease [Pseudohoeflea sp. DP4N28-3]
MTITILFISFFALLALGMPIAFAVGVASLLIIALDPTLLAYIVTSKFFAGIDSFTLLAIPFFIFAGELCTESGLTARIVHFANVLVGRFFRVGLAYVNILSSMIFAGVSGSITADSAAMGSLLIPSMKKEGYDSDYAVAVTATSGTIGALIPPSILMVLYGSLTSLSVGQLFLGGIVPGFLFGATLMIVAYVVGRLRGYDFRISDVAGASEGPYWKELLRAFRSASIALIIPLIIVGGIVGGFATPTEAGVLAVACALIAGLFFYRTLSWRRIYEASYRTALLTAVVMAIIAFSTLFSDILTRNDFQNWLLGNIGMVSENRYVYLTLILLMLFVLGFVLDVTAMLIMFAAPLSAIGLTLGFDPIHFGVIIVMVSLLGACTPPVGTLLLIGCSIANIPLTRVVGTVAWFVGAQLLVCIFLMFVPEAVTFVPNLVFNR